MLYENFSNKTLVARSWKVIEGFRWSLNIVILTVLRDYYSIQIMALYIISVAVQVLNVYYKPIENKIELRITIFNEIMTSFYLYMTLILTDFNGENPMRDRIGFSLLILMICAVLVNLVKAFVIDFLRVRNVVRKWIRKR